ncbi:hypothetical protein KY290_005789 [Solanum tuberosum]|uniref:Uncharacterized protein n=1 Tax=Solanum tuberosum TaxID=4113 RepID=A0ABQ7WF52_SOLTU|nr:hypothetical protein KY284_033609 [Solanum tuberosum]KAH0648900.1 hypothetical protein KY285_034148 [Solanum tuberosum]KAH0779362.1 hypothetical protein KY290_005789 [Solanum tuberosum]
MPEHTSDMAESNSFVYLVDNMEGKKWELGRCCGTKINFMCPFTLMLAKDANVAVSAAKDIGLEWKWIDQFEGHPSIKLKDSLFCLLNQNFDVSCY